MRKMQTRGVWALLLTVVLLLVLSPTAQAANKPQLQLSLNHTKVKVGQEVIVDVLVRNAPLIYGADVRLVFDPKMLEVVDADKKQPGIQLTPGNFLDPAKSFFLQHQIDNEIGTIDYALTLLNPAPPVRGDGLLMRVTFRAKSEGQTTISVAEGLFGNQAGETIAPALDSAGIRIAATDASLPMPADGGGSRLSLGLLGAVVVVVIGLAAGGLVLAVRRRRRQRG